MKRILSCVVVSIAVAGCTPDQPVTETSTSSVPAWSTPPPVTRPVDPSAYATEDTVCGLLTDDQIVAFDLPSSATSVKVTDVRVDCQRPKQGGERWQVDYTLWLNVDLVREWYSIKDDIKDAFELRYVEGQPAAVRESEGGWSCNVAVTLAERKSLQVMIRGSRREDDACSHVISVAERIVRNIKG